MYSTGNEYVSIPEIERNGSIRSFNVLSMDTRGMIEFRSSDNPFMEFTVVVDGKPVPSSCYDFSLDRYWIPMFKAEIGNFRIAVKLLAPVGYKGFMYSFEFCNEGNANRDIEILFHGNWTHTLHTVNESKTFEGSMNVYETGWSSCPCFDIRSGFPVMAFAPDTTKPSVWKTDRNDGISWSCSSSFRVESKKKEEWGIVWGVGFEEVAAVTAGRDMIRHGVNDLYEETCHYLDRIIRNEGSDRFRETLNRNLLFSIFFSTGRTIDTEELVTATSRSPRYYVSAAYWDRDTLLWSFPAIVQADRNLAREILSYVSTRQRRNVGVHSRYIDGTVLESGFELDELCAPVIAIENYIEVTGDEEILDDSDIVKLVDSIVSQIKGKRNEILGLYETFLQPTDDMRTYPYITYDNVLVWKVFRILAKWNWRGKGKDWDVQSVLLKDDINSNCIREFDGKMQYVWSVDEVGNFDIYDEPPGSLILLPVFDFVSRTDEAWMNTYDQITDPSYEYSFSGRRFGAIGCPHAPHPWVLSLCNLVRVNGDQNALEKLLNAEMDDGIACESIDEDTGISTTGDAFATCAGYLAATLMGEIR